MKTSRGTQMLRLALLSGVLASVAGAERAVLACKCRGPVPACQETWEVDAVFVGEVTAVRATPDGDDVTFDVREAFRGVQPGPLRMDRPMGTCSYGKFEQGRSYLVFAQRNGRGLATTRCNGTRPVEEAVDALDYLRGLSSLPPQSEGALRGTVLLSGDGTEARAVPGLEVAITGSHGTRHVRTDRDGRFMLRVPPDTYVLTVQPPAGYEVPGPQAPQLRDPRGCVVAEIYLHKR